MKFVASWMLVALGLSLSAAAQQIPTTNPTPRAVLDAHRVGIAVAAPVYGYDLQTGDWIVHELPCPAMPQVAMFRYTRQFPGGSESLFTALVPRGTGTVSIVPVLRHGRTPFTPAPDNPQNVALFNRLVGAATVQQKLKSEDGWRELGNCYAYMTGSNAIAAPGRSIGVAGAPVPFLHVGSKGKDTTLTFADRDSFGAYRLWTLRFNKRGRLTAASARNYAVSSTKTKPAQKAVSQTKAPPPLPTSPETTAMLPSSNGTPQHLNLVSEQVAKSAAISKSGSPAQEQGWTFIGNPPPPPAKFVPAAPPPPAKFIPNPPSR